LFHGSEGAVCAKLHAPDDLTPRIWDSPSACLDDNLFSIHRLV
jgi:hypothetical protein